MPNDHPFAANEEKLTTAIGASFRNRTGDLKVDEVTLKLPSARGVPLSSTNLIGSTEQESKGVIALEAWSIPGFAFAPVDILDVLSICEEEIPHGSVLGDSLRYWNEAAKLVSEWLARGRVIPSLVRADGHYEARWKPVAHEEEDAARCRLLAETMPPICRAENLPGGNEPSASSLLDAFLCEMADGASRRFLTGASLGPPKTKQRSATADLATSFLKALTCPDPTLPGDIETISHLASEIRNWQGGLEEAAPGALRTCFRLEPPVEPEERNEKDSGNQDKWRLKFLLQATDDKSLLIPAEETWKTRSGVVRFLRRTFEQPQERLLADLGRAMRLFPALEAALRNARPSGIDLQTEQAYDFLRQRVPLLEEAGFGVLVPPWWKKPTARLGARLKVKALGNGSLGANSMVGVGGLVQYSWELALGDEKLTPEEFAKLAALKVPLVKVRGQWVELKPEEIEAAIAYFQGHRAGGEMTVGEALRLTGEATSSLGLPVVGIEAEGWVARLLKDADAASKVELLKAPAGFIGKLRPYQVRGLSWLAFLGRHGLGACLADDMGLGKTIQLIALLLDERQGAKERPAPTLLVCPMSVVGNWQREVRKFAPSLDVQVHHGSDRSNAKEFSADARDKDLVITTYAIATRDQESLRQVEWGRIALDEAQNIKNSTTKQAQAIRHLEAAQRVALTGTPVENRLTELWSIMEFLNPGYLGSAADFRARFAIPVERYRDEERAGALKRLVQPFMLRRLKTDKSIIKDLPDKIENRVFCNLTREQASLYEAVIKEMLEKIESAEGIERKGLVLSTLMKLKQVCNHPAHFLQDRSELSGRSGKLARLSEMLDEVVAEGDQALVFTQFAEMGQMLKTYLQDYLGREVLFLFGGTPRPARDAMVARFQERGREAPVFVLSLKAGGTGLNLTAANHVFHFDRWWNPAVENQATDRAFRIGQRKNVQVHKYLCVGTLEERIDAMIEQKKELAESIIGAGESWLTELSTAELRELFVLGRDAVGEE